MVAALIKITQAANTDLAGRALVGDTSTSVVFSNGDDTGVVSWQYELLYTPPASALVPQTQGPDIQTTFTMATPDVPGSYRARLTVLDSNGVSDVDIRNFIVPTANRAYLIPPFQGNPIPLPLVGAGSKPDEMNVGGQLFGWAGDEDPTRRLLHQLILDVDADLP